jgi:hypothetical protein
MNFQVLKQILILAICFPLVIKAQQANQQEQKPYEALRAAQEVSAVVRFMPASINLKEASVVDAVAAYLQQTEPELAMPGMALHLLYNKQSRLGRHLLFAQTYKGVRVLGATIKVNMDANGNVLSVLKTLQPIQSDVDVQNTSADARWLLVNNQPTLVYSYLQGEKYIVKDAEGNSISERDAKLYLMGDDTTAAGKVFMPDPLTPISVISGQNGTYKHFNDSDYALLNDQRVEVLFPVTFDNGVFSLKNEYVEVLDFLAPSIAPPTPATPSFEYLRGDDGFKDVMVLYHITNLQQQLQTLGINQVNVPIKCDAHATTQDNSSFLPTDTTLRFGTGGVPDAEDADVIVHEFTHALSFFIAPSETMSSERRAIEEAVCDIQAAIYSHRYATFNWRKLYNWDAPNPVASGTSPFWNGRNGASTKTYAQYTGNPYADCEIWSSTILDIAEAVGHDSTLVLLFASLASYTDQTTMPQAAQLFMQADSVLMNNAYGWKIGPIFNARKLGNFPTAIPEVQRLMQTLSIANTAEFAMGTGNAVLELPFDAMMKVYDISGRLMEQTNVKSGTFTFRSDDYKSGMYIIRLSSQGSEVAIKLVR